MNMKNRLLKIFVCSFLMLLPAALVVAEDASDGKVESKEFYMIGISSYPVSSSLRVHLPELPEGQGLQIKHIIDEGVGAEILKNYDILLEANNVPLKSIDDLFRVIQKAGQDDQQIEMKLIRSGKSISVTVPTPKKADRSRRSPSSKRSPFSDDRHRKMSRFGPGKHHGHHKKHDSFDMSRIPGHILDMRFPNKLSTLRSSFRTEDGYFVVVEQSGEKVSIFVVSKDGKRWDAKADDLESLPESVRAEIQLRLKDFPDHNRNQPIKDSFSSTSENDAKIQKLESKIGQMSEQLKSLTKVIEALDEKLSKVEK